MASNGSRAKEIDRVMMEDSLNLRMQVNWLGMLDSPQADYRPSGESMVH
jgi:hypothetical protein